MNLSTLTMKRAFAILIFSWLTLFMEVLCTRIFAFTLWYQLGFMAISIALLGFAGAGTWLSLPGKMPNLDKILPWVSALTSLSIIICFSLASHFQFSLDSSLIPKMLILYGLIVIPFFFFGIVIALSFKHHSMKPGWVYFWNLSGSALGALSIFWLLPRIGAERCLVLSSGLAFLIACLFLKEANKKILLSLSLAGIALILGLLLPSQIFPFRPLKNKTMFQHLKMIPGTRIEQTLWASPTRIDIVDDPSGSLIFGKPLAYKFIYMNGEFPTMILKISPENDLKPFFRKSPYNLSYLVKPKPEKVLIIGPGGGVDVHNALWQEVREVDAVEVNPAIVKVVKKDYASYTGELYQDRACRWLLVMAETGCDGLQNNTI